jgi:peptidoglycan/xylan/chitin deacetylase (PgdA/CDA1 family)
MNKDVLLAGLNAAGCFALCRALNHHRGVVVTFHRFGDGDGRTPAAVFDAQVGYLREHYRVVPVSELWARLRGGGRDARRLAAVTIDDGYRDCHDVALPILRRHGVPATVFVTTAFVGGRIWLWTDKLRYLARAAADGTWDLRIGDRSVRTSWTTPVEAVRAAHMVIACLKTVGDAERERIVDRAAAQLGMAVPERPTADFAAMTWDDVRRLESCSVEIGAHTVTHPVLTQVGSKRLKFELLDARDELSRELRHSVDTFCYPNGDHDPSIRRAVADAGYTCAVTTAAGLNGAGADPFALRRVHTAPDLLRFVQGTCVFEELKAHGRRLRPPYSGVDGGKPTAAPAQARA